MARATTTVMIRDQVATTWPICTPEELSKKWLRDRPVSGFHMVRVRPMKASISPTVTISCTTRATLRNRRISSLSRATPSSGAMTKMTTNRASGAGQFRLTRSSQ